MHHLTQAQQVELIAAFGRFDLDGSGAIDASEMKEVMEQLGCPMTDSGVRCTPPRLGAAAFAAASSHEVAHPTCTCLNNTYLFNTRPSTWSWQTGNLSN